jgi:hypothetical protein
MNSSLRNALLVWACALPSVSLSGEALPSADLTHLAERSPFGNKPKVIVRKELEAPVRPVPDTLEFRGVLAIGEEVHCIIHDKAKRQDDLVRVRDSSAPCFIERYDEKSQSITVKTPYGPKVLNLKDPTQQGSFGSSSSNGYGSNYDDDYGRYDNSPADEPYNPFGSGDDYRENYNGYYSDEDNSWA